MEQTNESFSLVGCIEDIIKVLNDNLDLVAIVELLIIIVLVIVYCRQKAKDREYYNQLDEKYLDCHKQNTALQQDNQDLRTKNNNLTVLVRKLSALENSNKNTTIPTGSESQKDTEGSNSCQDDPENEIKEKHSEEDHVYIDNHYNYLELSNKGKFLKLKVTNDKCYFRTWIDGNVRKYEFCGNTAKALANLNATFDDSCVIEGKQNGATEIINVEPGILSDDLTIKTKAIIRLQ